MREKAKQYQLKSNRIHRVMKTKRIIIIGISFLVLSSLLNAKGFRIELNTGYFYPSEKAFRDIYGNGLIYGLDISKNIWKEMELHLDCKYFSKKGKLTFTQETTKIQLVPLGLSLRYTFLKKKFNLYAGAGLTYVSFEEKNPIGKVRKNQMGFAVKAGVLRRLKTDKKFLKAIVVDACINYHYCKMKPADIKFDAGGIDLGIGLGVEF